MKYIGDVFNALLKEGNSFDKGVEFPEFEIKHELSEVPKGFKQFDCPSHGLSVCALSEGAYPLHVIIEVDETTSKQWGIRQRFAWPLSHWVASGLPVAISEIPLRMDTWIPRRIHKRVKQKGGRMPLIAHTWSFYQDVGISRVPRHLIKGAKIKEHQFLSSIFEDMVPNGGFVKISDAPGIVRGYFVKKVFRSFKGRKPSRR